jgi:hypothetical protein
MSGAAILEDISTYVAYDAHVTHKDTVVARSRANILTTRELLAHKSGPFPEHSGTGYALACLSVPPTATTTVKTVFSVVSPNL